MRKIIYSLLCSVLMVTSVNAGFIDAKINLKYQQYNAALKEFSDLAEQGNTASLYYLGYMYKNGLGVAKNLKAAYGYFKRADEKYYPPAAGELGKMLLTGEGGIPVSYNQAIILLKKAGLSGISDATFELGSLYLTGAGSGVNAIPVNYNKAFGYFLLSGLKGNPRAQVQLSKMYFSGHGVPQDYSRGITWLARAANQGYVKAELELATLFETDVRLANLPEAYAWYSVLAAYNSDTVGKMATEKRDALAGRLSSEQLMGQQAIIRQWKPKTSEQSVPAAERAATAVPVIQDFNDPNTIQQIIAVDGMWPMDGTVFGISQDMLDLAEASGDLLELDTIVDKAIKRGSGRAGAYYGDFLSKRLHNDAAAFTWYKRAADAGDTYGRFQLAKFYCEGKSVEPNAAECYNLFLLVQKAQDPVLNVLTQQAIATVRANATPEELERGRAKAENREQNQEQEKKQKPVLDFL